MNKAEAKNLFELALTSDNPNVYKPAYKVLRTVMRDIVLTKRDVMHWMTAINIRVVYMESYKLADGTRQYDLSMALGYYGKYLQESRTTVIASSWSGAIYKAAYKLLGYKHNLTMKQLHDIEAWSYDTKSQYKG